MFIAASSVHLKSKLGKLAVDQCHDASKLIPGFKNECTIINVDYGEEVKEEVLEQVSLSLMINWPHAWVKVERLFIVINFRSVMIYSASGVLKKSITRNRNNTKAIQSISVTPTICYILVPIFPNLSTTLTSVYTFSMQEKIIGVSTHCYNTEMIRSWFTISNTFTKSTKSTNVVEL